MDVFILMDHRVKIKEKEKIKKYLDLARELKKLQNMRVVGMPIVISELGTILKGLEEWQKELEIRGIIKTTHTTVLLKSARIFRWALAT